jgi:hypothetical protein
MTQEIHIPTVTGSNIISISDADIEKPKQLVAKVNQLSGNPLTMDIIKNEVGFTSVFKLATGLWLDFTGLPYPPENLTILGSLEKGNNFSVDEELVGYEFSLTGSSLTIRSYQSKTGAAPNAVLPTVEFEDIIENGTLVINAYPSTEANPLTIEGRFDIMLESLDSNQIKLWSKAIVRTTGGVVTEVDGDKYRKTGDFSQSSKVIES